MSIGEHSCASALLHSLADPICEGIRKETNAVTGMLSVLTGMTRQDVTVAPLRPPPIELNNAPWIPWQGDHDRGQSPN